MSKSAQSPRAAAAEPDFLPHPLMDRLLDITVALGAELWAERERRMTVERLLEARGLLSAADIEQFLPDDAELEVRKRQRDEYVSRLFDGLKTLK